MKNWICIIILLAGSLLEANAGVPPRRIKRGNSSTSCTMTRMKFSGGDLLEYRFGAVVGQNYSKLYNDFDIAMDYLTGLSGGVAAQILWPGGFGIQPEILYSKQGCKFVGSEILHSIDYVKIPVKVMYRLRLADIAPFVFAVPYAAYHIGGDDEFPSDFFLPDQINKFDFGVGVGAGFDVWSRVQLSFHYKWGLAQITKDSFTTQNRVLTISAGVFF